ncbi:hypothetical protein F3Y22_tig00110879pilonHSYRG00057 [Hibiscus syriacus]|uniref:Uncharacterized protein n=1 Tax=Hibiscus syriacus TaxID=106335 RepID=A0A6A2ZKF0_HIBSY|nr:hypothetical protein F3Y22_tig00110879pilonHSYRG00057 [Hibiscus syriacus]
MQVKVRSANVTEDAICKKWLPLISIRHFGRKVAKGLIRIFRPPPPKVTSSSSSTRPKPFEAPVVDCHRTAAIEDCIQFINSSASLTGSISVSATSH